MQAGCDKEVNIVAREGARFTSAGKVRCTETQHAGVRPATVSRAALGFLTWAPLGLPPAALPPAAGQTLLPSSAASAAASQPDLGLLPPGAL